MPGNLPAPITPFVGRRQELAQIDALFRDPGCRLLTILGPGGIGKTRLAIEAARCTVDEYADGVAYADLQPVAEVQYLPETIAHGAGLQLAGHEEPAEQLVAFLKDKQILLLLDNFEHLLEGAELVSRILTAAPAARCLATSREVLNLREEWLYPLRGLRLPEEGTPADMATHEADAVELFAQCAHRVRRDFDLEAERSSVVRICQLVEGMPLAIELAASWSRTLTANAIERQIQQGLDFLATGMRNVPARHRSMHAALQQSWQRLAEEEQQVFARLSVFRGGFRRAQAEAVAGAPLPILAHFVDCSLLRWGPDGRYTLHELVRQFAAERLRETPDAEVETYRRHSQAYGDFLYERSETLLGPRQSQVLEEIRPELDNIRAGLQWAIAQADIETLYRLEIIYYEYCDWRGLYRENTDVLEQAVTRLQETEQTIAVRQLVAICHAFLGWCYIRLGQFHESIASSERSEAIYAELGMDPPPGFGTDPLPGLGLAHHILGNYEQAVASAEAARRRDAVQGDELNLMIAEYVLCTVHLALDDLDSARSHGLAAVALATQHSNSWFQAYVLMELGNIALAEGDLAGARLCYLESFDLKESVVDPEGMAVALNQLGQIALMEGDHHEAERLHQRSLALYERISDPGGRANTLHGLGNAAAARTATAAAAAAYRQALEILLEIRFWPRALAVLVDVAALLSHAEHLADVSALLRTVLAHPATDGLTQRRARDLHTELFGDVPLPASPDQGTDPPDLNVEISATVRLLATVQDAAQLAVQPVDPVTAANQQLVEPLTARELEVLQLMSTGMTNPQIADRLIISVGTVKSYTAQIFGKLAVRNRTQAVNRARKKGLLSESV